MDAAGWTSGWATKKGVQTCVPSRWGIREPLEAIIRHAGDPVIAEQRAWTGVDRYENGDPRRLRKLERSRPIDVSVALALAVWRVVHGGATRSVYATRGLDHGLVFRLVGRRLFRIRPATQ